MLAARQSGSPSSCRSPRGAGAVWLCILEQDAGEEVPSRKACKLVPAFYWGSRHGAQRRGQPRDVGTWIVLDACLFLLAFLAGCMEKGELSHF